MRFLQGAGLFLWCVGMFLLVAELAATGGAEVAPWVMGSGVAVGAIGVTWVNLASRRSSE